MRPGNKPADIHVANRGMNIHHGLNGNKHVSVDRPDHSRVVADRGRGYVERSHSFRGHEYGHRTYYRHGRAYDHFYRRYHYHGVDLDVYAPQFYYPAAFYGWAYNPWVAPVPYAWGWGAAPWYGYYGFYFAPYPVYPSASVWLADYLISTSLAASYEAKSNPAPQGQQFAANSAPAGATPLSPQVKDQIAAEVQRQIALENVEARTSAQNQEPDPASSGINRMFIDNAPHVFVAGNELDVLDATGAECAISDGDALRLNAPPPETSATASLTMLSSKGGSECRAGAKVTVNLSDLQDMQNHMRETIDQGMGDLKSNQGKGGLPTLPSSASGAPVKAPFEATAPPPEPNVAAEINQQVQDADQVEKQTLAEVSAESGASAGPTVAIGQSIDAVTTAMGQPIDMADVGGKKIFLYKDIKVTFANGKVSNVQDVSSAP
jgi:hypothetical protein